MILKVCGTCHDDANDPGFEFEVEKRIEAQRHGTIESAATKAGESAFHTTPHATPHATPHGTPSRAPHASVLGTSQAHASLGALGTQVAQHDRALLRSAFLRSAAKRIESEEEVPARADTLSTAAHSDPS